MSRELSLYEAMGGTYRSVAGILYPNIGMDDVDTKSDMASVVTANQNPHEPTSRQNVHDNSPQIMVY